MTGNSSHSQPTRPSGRATPVRLTKKDAAQGDDSKRKSTTSELNLKQIFVNFEGAIACLRRCSMIKDAE